MTPFLENSTKRKLCYRDRKQVHGCFGVGTGRRTHKGIYTHGVKHVKLVYADFISATLFSQ